MIPTIDLIILSQPDCIAIKENWRWSSKVYVPVEIWEQRIAATPHEDGYTREYLTALYFWLIA